MARSPSETSSVKRLVLIAPDGLSLLRQRAELVADILARRHSILALIPEHAAASIPALNENGMAAATFPLRGDAPSLLGDGKTVTSIATTLADWRAAAIGTVERSCRRATTVTNDDPAASSSPAAARNTGRCHTRAPTRPGLSGAFIGGLLTSA